MDIDKSLHQSIIERELTENIIPPVGYDEYLLVRNKWLNTENWPTGDEIRTVVLMGSHIGTVIRIAYLKTVWRMKLEPAAFWNAIVKVFIFGLWAEDFDKLLKTAEAKKIINKTTHPEWVVVGVVGTDWKKLRGMCEKFCKWYESLVRRA